MPVSRLVDRARTYTRLGLANLGRVALYRLGVRTGLHPVLAIAEKKAIGPYFGPPAARASGSVHRPTRWTAFHESFFAHQFPLRDPPAWNESPFEPGKAIDNTRPWNEIGDFDSGVGDIKTVWEASRYDWVVAMAQRASLGEVSELERLNRWLADWQEACPPYYGANWKCGQEAAIRVLHLAAAHLVLREPSPLPGLLDLLEQHLARIAPTMGYARGQDNNHGTSEAAALFVGGGILAASGRAGGFKWQSAGRDALEERVAALIEPDGTFSQYSVTYHRLMLDTLSLCEVWRRRSGHEAFSQRFLTKAAAATHWLRQFTDPTTGDAPNLGANDGAMLIPLADTPYRDFRPSVQLASAVFCEFDAFPGCESARRPLDWLGLATPAAAAPPLTSETFDSGGIHVLRAGSAVAYLRYPRLRFRPSQADFLQCDLWFEGRNLVHDGGSYSYASDEHQHFSGTGSHSTVEFDGRDQMPRLSRFLFGAWPAATGIERVDQRGDRVAAAAGYTDWLGATHHRMLELRPRSLVCRDVLSGHFAKAVIRWRLPPSEWELTGQGAVGMGVTLQVNSGDSAPEMRLVMRPESLAYLVQDPVPVLELHCSAPGTIETEISFS